MANGGVNVKMGVTGVAQFKQNINTARNSLKTLDAQLALNEKQFKASGDAEAYMQEKTKLLKDKLEEQKAVVSETEKALEKLASEGATKTSKAFQDMQQQLLRAKSEMLDTEQEMQGIETAGSEAADGVEDMNNALASVGTGIGVQNVTDALDKITSGMKLAITKAWELGQLGGRPGNASGILPDEPGRAPADGEDREHHRHQRRIHHRGAEKAEKGHGSRRRRNERDVRGAGRDPGTAQGPV